MRAQRSEISSSQSMTVRYRGGGRTMGPEGSGQGVDFIVIMRATMLATRNIILKLLLILDDHV
jgi:hypothetical protein